MEAATPPAEAGLPASAKSPAAKAKPAAQAPGDRKNTDELLAAGAAAAEDPDAVLSEVDQIDLLDYFLSNDDLPGEEPHDVEFSVGIGKNQVKNTWKIKRITYDEWRDSIERSITDKETGERDALMGAAYIVARALVEPKLGPLVKRAQEKAGKTPGGVPPRDGAHLLRMMFEKESGVLYEISGQVQKISKLDDGDGSTRLVDQEVQAGKP